MGEYKQFLLDRRTFLKHSAWAALSIGVLPMTLTRVLAAAVTPGAVGAKKKILVVVFQRGAADGLSIVAPHGDPHYRLLRPSIGVLPDHGLIKLDEYHGLHPSLVSIKRFWDEGTLAFVHEAGSPDATRSHFDAQDYMESGTPGVKVTDDGYLNRALREQKDYDGHSPLRAVALQPNLPRSLLGPAPALSMNSIHDFGIRSPSTSNVAVVSGFENMYQQAVDRAFRGVGQETFEALSKVHESDNKNNQASYPKSETARRLREIARLIKSDSGMQLAVTDVGGWDTHINQGAGEGQLSNRLKELAEALAAFADDLGPRFADVCVVGMTEFGRTAKENGTRGTDHGHGSVMMVLGGSVAGRKIHAKVRSLATDNLYEGRDLPVTTDFRDVLGEILSKQLGVGDLAKVFPKYANDPKAWKGLLKA